jgi:EAL domain-containing protein (putative c-di-GMP-specific phosphodiesterase class I)
VSSKEGLEMLRAFGVDMAQGYFIGEPCPAAEVVACRRRIVEGSLVRTGAGD